MDIFQTIGLAWIILTSACATVAFFYFAVTGMKTKLADAAKGAEVRDLERAAR